MSREDFAAMAIQFYQLILPFLVDRPESIGVSAVIGEQTTVIKVKVHPIDLGKIIGRHGRNALALRTLLFVIGARHRQRAVLEIEE